MKNFISIIIPLYNEEKNVPALIEGLFEILEPRDFTFEIIFVDDGSRDNTFDVVKRAASKDGRIKCVRFRRNFGQTIAIKAGIDLAEGDTCITMDGDMQHDPKEIPEFMDKINAGYDLVCGFRNKRLDGFLRRFPSKIANFMARKFSRLNIRDFGSTYRAYRTSRLWGNASIYSDICGDDHGQDYGNPHIDTSKDARHIKLWPCQDIQSLIRFTPCHIFCRLFHTPYSSLRIFFIGIVFTWLFHLSLAEFSQNLLEYRHNGLRPSFCLRDSALFGCIAAFYHGGRL